jgi:FixJ family two-component response regulator
MTNKIEIAVVDDDEGGRNSMCSLLAAAGYAARLYASARLFLEDFNPAIACVIVDLEMPQMGGLELQEALTRRNIELPIIFVTGHGRVSCAVQALSAGAVDFIEKPFLSEAMLDGIARALKIGQKSFIDFAKVRNARTTLALLTSRERSVANLLVKGYSARKAAYELGISPRTLEFHRARIMNKMSTRTITDVVRVVTMAA